MTIANDKMHTICSFLERPVRIWSGQFSANATQGLVLFTGTFPDILLADPMYNEKIRGFVGLRANVEVTVQVNAQKFQQGRLRLQYLPYQKYLTHKTSSINATLTGRVSCPGVDIDICGGSNPQSRIAQATFIIPYVSPHAYINLITGYGTMGQVGLFVYSPLMTGTGESNNCEVTIWARFIEPKLAFPTSASPYVQPRSHIAQVRGEAKKLKQTGVISQTLGRVADTLHTASKIPVIGQYMAIPEWIASSGEALCKLFGWSKPTLPMDTKLRTTNCMTNYNGQDSSHKMALSADNEIDTPKGIGGSDLDEMALSSIFKIPAYWQQFTWDVSQTTTDQILWIDPVTPFKYSLIEDTSNGINMTPVGYVANCFGLWRGSMIYTFKLVKTGFHTGRLRVFFVPYEKASNLVVGSAPVNEIEKNYQIVVDIEESDTFSFKVPYVATKPWSNVSAIGTSSNTVPTTTGYIVVTILNELRTVSSISSTINILVEVSGGDDLTFACPSAPIFIPGAPSASSRKQHEAQVLGTAVEVPRNEAQLLYDPNSITHIDPLTNWSPEAHCIGEKVVSVRQLIKRSNYIGSIVENRTNYNMGGNGTNNNTLGVINPYGIKTSSTISGLDYMSYFANLYTFFRGGVRIKIAGVSQSADGPKVNSPPSWMSRPYSTSNIFVKMFNSLNPLMATIVNYTTTLNSILGKIGCYGLQFAGNNQNVEVDMHPLFSNSSSTVIVSNMIEGITEIEVPYYNSTHITPCIDNGPESSMFPVITQSEADGAYPLPVLVFGTIPYNTNLTLTQAVGSNPSSTVLTSATQTSFHVYRQAADDFSFHYIIGIPIMINDGPTNDRTFIPTAP